MIIGSRQKLQNTNINSNIKIAFGGNEVKQVLTTKSLLIKNYVAKNILIATVKGFPALLELLVVLNLMLIPVA